MNIIETRRSICANLIGAIMAMSVLCAPLVGFAQGLGGMEIDLIDAVIQVNRDASFDVVETIDGEFFEPRHGIFRRLPIRYERDDGTTQTISMRVDQVRLNNAPVPYETYRDGGYLVVQIGDPDVTFMGEFSYSLVYHVERAMLYHDTEDELYWNVSTDEWGTAVTRTTASIELPDPDVREVSVACYTGAIGSTAQACDISVHEDLITASADDTLTVSIVFPKLVVYEPGMDRVVLWWLRDNWDYLLLILPVLVLIGLFAHWWHMGRDPKGRGTIVPEYDPVDELSPTEIGALLDATVHPRDFSAAIVDLAVRGYLLIEETKTKTVFSPATHTLKKLKEPDAHLRPFERVLLEELFRSGPEVVLDAAKPALLNARKKVERELYVSMAERGYFMRNPQTVRFLYFGAGVALAFFGHVIGLMAVYATERPIALFAAYASAGFFFLFAPIMPRKTPKGALALEHAKGFKLYLQTAEQQRMQWQEKEGLFEKFLPYAMVYGVVDKWTRVFAESQRLEQPTWYTGSAAAFNATDFGTRMNTFANTTANLSAPSSSGGGGGGGSSGGGFGGGGGGSW